VTDEVVAKTQKVTAVQTALFDDETFGEVDPANSTDVSEFAQ
jgi:hypothetical protein